ncbi:unnamed protein product [Euphydryas editha]|uniref:L1 transposable element RRM domain-containing protein n=1 Tax=Euphydryas editha TaxID=104508 RepID=A0AAU9TPS5_EUPED|nr:unnamed protein product [Euphydryas editha]
MIRSPKSNEPKHNSQPDLSRMTEEIPTITIRKRKQPDPDSDYKNEIQGLRSELSRMNTLLENFVLSQEKLMNDMRENIATLSGEIKEIKASTSGIMKDQVSIKNCISDLSSKISTHETRLISIESDLNTYNTTSEPNKLKQNEEIIHELQERKKRENNIILVGVSEQWNTSTKERIERDEAEVLNTISLITKDIPKPVKIFRIGKYNAEKNRKLKVCFDKREPVVLLLRNKDKLPHNIRIFSDQTPAQQKYFLAIKDELTKRKNNGEDDITIKYINGIPKIVKLIPKNSNNQ